MNEDAKVRACALRGRVKANDGIFSQQLEIGEDIANCITSVAKDSLVIIYEYDCKD